MQKLKWFLAAKSSHSLWLAAIVILAAALRIWLCSTDSYLHEWDDADALAFVGCHKGAKQRCGEKHRTLDAPVLAFCSANTVVDGSDEAQ